MATPNNYFLVSEHWVCRDFQKQGNIWSFRLEKQDDSMISFFIEKGILGGHFQAVKQTPGTTSTDGSDIVPYAGDGVCGFVSPVLRHYQQD